MMSNAIACDNCDTHLVLDERGDDSDGHVSAWIRVQAGGRRWDFCTRACTAEALGDGEPLGDAMDAQFEAVAVIVRALNDEEADRG